MPIKDPEKRRQANAARMRARRQAGTAWEDPAKEAERKARWYYERGGKARRLKLSRLERERAREQGIRDFARRHTERS